MKRTAALFGATLMTLTGLSVFTACKPKQEEEKQKTVMNISLNPEVEFVLDGENKVVTANAINEEGNLIISSDAFNDIEGKTAEQAAKLFVEVSKDTGYLVEGEVRSGENELKISFSGDLELATTLYNSVETQIKDYLATVDVNATIAQAEAITEEQLKALIAECEPYLETAEMQYAELVETLISSRQETAEFFSQELKHVYYEAKNFAMEQAELEVMSEKLSTAKKVAFKVITGVHETNVKIIEGKRKVFLLDENSLYNQALKALQDIKIDYIKARTEVKAGGFTAEVELNLAGIQEKVAAAEAALKKAAENLNAGLNKEMDLIVTHYNKAIQLLEEESVKMEENLPAIAKKRQEVQDSFFKSFEKSYKSAATAYDASWATMETALRATVKTEVSVG